MITMMVLSAALAAEPDGAALAREAHDILKANCYRCHGQDGAVEGGMNYVLDFKTLVARKKVVPGDATRSKLYKRLTSDDNPMPPSDERARPTKDDIALVRRWIDAGAPGLPAAPAKRDYLTEADVTRLIRDDLDEMDEHARRFARYFSIAHLANAGLPENQLQTYRLGLAKLVNSLSWQPDVAVPKPIDAGRTVFRIDLRDYRWSAAVWQRVLDAYPYGVVQFTPAAQAVFAATGCELACVRADWFVFAASRPPLYHDVLQLPKTDAELEKELKIDVEANVREERSPDLARQLGPLKVEGGTVQRQVFVASFEDAVRALRLGTPLPALNRAIAERTEAIRITPRNARAFVERADGFYDKGDFDRAVADFTEALRLGPREANVYRGMAHANRGDYEKAIADYDEALRLEPRHAETLHNGGLAHARRDDTARALADLGEAIRLDPTNAAALSDRGYLHVRAGDADKARADLNEALRLQPRSAAALERRGEAHALKGDLDKALADYAAALELAPRFGEAYHRRALAHVRLGSTDKAVADFAEALRLEPHSAQAHADFALLLATSADAKLRDPRKAIEHARRAVELAPEKEKAEYRKKLKLIEQRKP